MFSKVIKPILMMGAAFFAGRISKGEPTHKYKNFVEVLNGPDIYNNYQAHYTTEQQAMFDELGTAATICEEIIESSVLCH
jgi:hypothetical protein